MRRFWLFRSNIRSLEYYHDYVDLAEFRRNCHDYYMIFPLWLLENDYFDEVTIWRLCHSPKKPIVFNVNGKLYKQRWVQSFRETFEYYPPDVSFWRGGFVEYDEVTKEEPSYFGLKLYLGAGRRVFPLWGGKYDVFLIEDERDRRPDIKCLNFYKTASPYIFFPVDSLTARWDICWPCNFTQLNYKGQELFIKILSESDYLKKLRIVHCGNRPQVGQKICRKYKVNNVEFMGLVSRPQLNLFLNQSLLGLNFSNQKDGCPRVSTEILASGIPLVVRDQTRLLNYYKDSGTIIVNNYNIEERIITVLSDYEQISKKFQSIRQKYSFEEVNKKNIEEWKKA